VLVLLCTVGTVCTRAPFWERPIPSEERTWSFMERTYPFVHHTTICSG